MMNFSLGIVLILQILIKPPNKPSITESMLKVVNKEPKSVLEVNKIEVL